MPRQPAGKGEGSDQQADERIGGEAASPAVGSEPAPQGPGSRPRTLMRNELETLRARLQKKFH
jgi:hypothetical protein